LVYTRYIPGIYRLYDNVGDIGGIYHTKTSIHLFGTSHVPPSTGHIPDIYLLYPGIWPVEGGTWLVPNKCIEVFVWYIPPISPTWSYRRYIPGIYLVYTNVKVYTWYIPRLYCINTGIYQVYTLTLIYTRYMLGIYLVYIRYVNVTELDTWWLVLRGRTGPHSSRASCDDISRPCDYSDFITPRAPTARILAPGHVSVKGALRTENSIYIPFLTSTAYKTIL